jgi:hypothetical protein
LPVPAIPHQEIAQAEVVVVVHAPAQPPTPQLRLVVHNPRRRRFRGDRNNRSVA